MHAAAVFDEVLRRLADGLSILIVNPWRCRGVDLLQGATLVVAAALIVHGATAIRPVLEPLVTKGVRTDRFLP